MRRTMMILALAAWAQEPTIRVTTRLVQVSVIVHDKNGPVADLEQDDFVVLDKGKPQKIAFFTMTTTRQPIVVATPQLPPHIFTNRPERRGPTPAAATIVLFDSLNTKFADQAYAREQILKFLKQLEPQDRIALYVLGRELRVLHDFTSDPERLTRAVARYRATSPAELEASTQEESDTGHADLDAFLDEASAVISDFYTVNRVRRTLAAMEAIAHHVSRLPGRKNLVWVSGSFPFSIGLDEPLSLTSNPAREHRTFNDEIERASRALNSANLAIYPVDARGLIGLPDQFSASSASRKGPIQPGRPVSFLPKNLDTMEALAERTGGRAFYNTNDIRGAIRQAIRDSEVTYTLGFYPAAGALDGKFHELKVQVKRKGVNARHRKGYFAGEEQPPTEKQRQAEIRDTLASPLEATDVGLTARVDRVEQPKPGLRVMVAVDASKLTLERKDDRWVGAAEVVFMQRGPEGKNLGGTAETLRINMKDESYQAARREGLVLVKHVQPAAGLEQLLIVVLDRPSGAIGSLVMAAANAPNDKGRP